MFVRQFRALIVYNIYICELGCTFVATRTHCRFAHPCNPDFPTGRPSRRKEWKKRGGFGLFCLDLLRMTKDLDATPGVHSMKHGMLEQREYRIPGTYRYSSVYGAYPFSYTHHQHHQTKEAVLILTSSSEY